MNREGKQMKFEIDEAIIADTTKCPKKFVCLKGKAHLHCMVERNVGGRVNFLACLSEESCPYQMLFAGDTACTCPVRREIYTRYNV